MDEEYMKQLWTSREVILEVVEDQGYTSNQESLTFQNFKNKFCADEETNPKSLINFIAKRENGKRIFVSWIIESKLRTNTTIYKQLEEEKINRAIIITDEGMTPKALEIVNKLYLQGKYFIFHYTLKETQFNISKHELVPKHTICTPEEKKELLETYSIKPSQCPEIKRTDVMVRHIGAIRGQLIKIERNSYILLGHKDIDYRIVT